MRLVSFKIFYILILFGSCTPEKSVESLTKWSIEYFENRNFNKKEVLLQNGRVIEEIYYKDDCIDSMTVFDTLLAQSVGGKIVDSTFDKCLDYFFNSDTIIDSLNVRFWKPIRRDFQYSFLLERDNNIIKILNITNNPVFEYNEATDSLDHIYYGIIQVLKNRKKIGTYKKFIFRTANGKLLFK